MWARIERITHFSKGEKAIILAYAAVMAMAAGLTIMIMSGVEGENAIPPEPTWYDTWVIVAGAIGGGAGLFVARSWMGMHGLLGAVRAVVACVIVAFAGAIVAGTLILPFYGTLFAPVMLVTELATLPVLAAAWFVVIIAAHLLFMVRADEMAWGYGHGNEGAVSQLSRLSQVNLYRR